MLHKLKHNVKKLLCKNSFESNFNVPIKFKKSEYFINERLIEIPFTHHHLLNINRGSKVLDFGCTRSWLSMELSALGYQVQGVDLRKYPYDHHNFSFNIGNILDMKNDKFDAVIALSVIEHIGIGVYGDEKDERALIKVLNKIYEMLMSDGVFIFTVPVGKASISDFERSFLPNEIDKIFSKYEFTKIAEEFYRRKNGRYWQSCNKEEIVQVKNDKPTLLKIGTGVNGCGCYVLKKN